MSEMTLRQLQDAILNIGHTNNAIDKCFYKLTEEVGELAKAIRKDRRIYLANLHGIDLTQCAMLKEKLNSEKYGRKSIFEE